MKTKTVLTTLFITLFIFSTFGIAQIQSEAAVLTRPDPTRNLINNIDLWNKFEYNVTAANAASVIPIFDSYEVMACIICTINKTSEDDFASTSDAVATGELADLNVSGGVMMSNEYYEDMKAEPVDYTAPSTTYTTMMRKVSAYSESDLDYFGDEEDLQYFSFESSTLSEIQEDLAESVAGRGWAASNINMTSTLIRVTYDYDLLKSIIDDMMADAAWDSVDPISDTKMRTLIETYLGPYQRAMFMGFGNYTALTEVTDKDDYELSTEIVETLDNKTDSSLDQFTAHSGFIGLQLFSYIAEYGINPTTASMVANGNFGPLNAPDRGILRGLELGMSAGIPVISTFLDADTYAVSADNDFIAGMRIVFANIVPYKAFSDVIAAGVEGITMSEWFATIVIVLLVWFCTAYLMGGGKWNGTSKDQGYLQKLKDKKRGHELLGTGLDWQMLLIPIVLAGSVTWQLLAYYN